MAKGKTKYPNLKVLKIVFVITKGILFFLIGIPLFSKVKEPIPFTISSK